MEVAVVMSPWHTVGAIAELFSWIGLGIGALCLVVWVITLATTGDWRETDAVRIEESQRRARWIADDGSLHERSLTPAEQHQLSGHDTFRVFYNVRSPDRMRLERTSHSVRLFRLLTIIFLGLGTLAVIVGFVVLFL